MSDDERKTGKDPLMVKPYAPTIVEESHSLLMSETVGRHQTVRIIARLLDLLERTSPRRVDSERDLTKWGVYRVSHGSSRFIENYARSDQANELRLARQAGIRRHEPIAYYVLGPGMVPEQWPTHAADAMIRAERFCTEHGEFEKDRADCPYCNG